MEVFSGTLNIIEEVSSSPLDDGVVPPAKEL
jgi:hypothetical protein